VKKFIRKRVQEVLKGANIDCIGEDVFCCRSIPSEIDALPVVLIYPQSSPSDIFSQAPKSYRHSYNLVIEIINQGDDDEDMQNEIDDISEKIIDALEADKELESELEYMTLNDSIYAHEAGGESPVFSERILYTFEYIRDARRQKNLPDLKRVGTTYKMNGNENGDNDLINLEV